MQSSFFLGPSTGIFGIFGCFLGTYIVIVDTLPWNHKIGTLLVVIVVVAFLIVLGNQSYVHNFAHLESLITGLSLGFCFFASRSSSNKRKILLLIIGFVFLIIALVPIVFNFFFISSPNKKPQITPEIS